MQVVLVVVNQLYSVVAARVLHEPVLEVQGCILVHPADVGHGAVGNRIDLYPPRLRAQRHEQKLAICGHVGHGTVAVGWRFDADRELRRHAVPNRRVAPVVVVNCENDHLGVAGYGDVGELKAVVARDSKALVDVRSDLIGLKGPYADVVDVQVHVNRLRRNVRIVRPAPYVDRAGSALTHVYATDRLLIGRHGTRKIHEAIQVATAANLGNAHCPDDGVPVRRIAVVR